MLFIKLCTHFECWINMSFDVRIWLIAKLSLRWEFVFIWLFPAIWIEIEVRMTEQIIKIYELFFSPSFCHISFCFFFIFIRFRNKSTIYYSILIYIMHSIRIRNIISCAERWWWQWCWVWQILKWIFLIFECSLDDERNIERNV